MRIDKYKYCIFLGIGGIGMSAIARYFHRLGIFVCGYDKTESPLTNELIHAGMQVFYDDAVHMVPDKILQEKNQTLVVITPAIPKDSVLLNYFTSQGYEIRKRSRVLGDITEGKKTIAVAGTHGKTSTSTILAWLLHNSKAGCNAFLGGISKNLDSNLIFNPQSDFMVTEADEFDRSFLNLRPDSAVITSIDPDHLDIYGDFSMLKTAFNDFVNLLPDNGLLLINSRAKDFVNIPDRIICKTYGLHDAEYFASDITTIKGRYHFSFNAPGIKIENISTGYPGLVNVENAIGALGILHMNGMDLNEFTGSLQKFTGVKRRFDVRLTGKNMIYIDDYAHHPEELNALIRSVREMYPGKIVTGIFQPHLFSRTRDFAEGFAQSLSKLDKLILLPIYPAREVPIEGVTSEIIFENVNCPTRFMIEKHELMGVIAGLKTDVLLTIGAGDIDRFVGQIEKFYSIES